MTRQRYRPTFGQIVGANIARVRKDRKMTQAEFGRQMGLRLRGSWSKQTVSALETGSRPIEIGEAVMAALILETDLDDLLSPRWWDDTRITDTSRIRLYGGPADNTRTTPTVRADEVKQVVTPPESTRMEALRQRVAEVMGIYDPSLRKTTKKESD